MDPLQIAEAFSGHRFTETYDELAANVRWVLPGHPPIEGKEAVVSACSSAADEMAQLASSEFSRFVSVAGDRVAAVDDAVGRYVSSDGDVSVVPRPPTSTSSTSRVWSPRSRHMQSSSTS